MDSGDLLMAPPPTGRPRLSTRRAAKRAAEKAALDAIRKMPPETRRRDLQYQFGVLLSDPIPRQRLSFPSCICTGNSPTIPVFDISLSRDSFRLCPSFELPTRLSEGGRRNIDYLIRQAVSNQRPIDLEAVERNTHTAVRPHRVIRVPLPSEPSRVLVAISHRSMVRLYDLQTREELMMWNHGSNLSMDGLAAYLRPNDEALIVSIGYGRCTRIMDPANGKLRLQQNYEFESFEQKSKTLRTPAKLVIVDEWRNCCGGNAFVGCEWGILSKLDLEREARVVLSYDGHRKRGQAQACHVRDVEVSVSKHVIFTSSEEPSVRLWARDDPVCIDVIDRSQGGVPFVGMKYVEGEKLLLVGCRHSGQVHAWDIRKLTTRVLQIDLPVGGYTHEIVAVNQHQDWFICATGNFFQPFNLTTGKFGVSTKFENVSYMGGGFDRGRKTVCMLDDGLEKLAGNLRAEEEERIEFLVGLASTGRLCGHSWVVFGGMQRRRLLFPRLYLRHH